MRTIVKQFNIYSFDELAKETQQKIIQDEKEQLINFNFECLEDDYITKLKEDYNLCNVSVSYQLEYAQGDHFDFFTSDFNLLRYDILKNKDVKNANPFEKHILDNLIYAEGWGLAFIEDWELLLDYLNSGYNFGIIHSRVGGRVYLDYLSPLSGFDNDNLNELLAVICEDFKTIYENICQKMKHFGYSYYDMEDDDVIEYIKDNGYEYLVDGTYYAE